MLNITFTGKVYDENNQIVNNCKYRGLFIKQNSNSSPSQFNNERITFQGEYNINLGDGDWLTQNGVAGSGDRVVILFWIPENENNLSLNLTKFGFFELTLTSETTYIINAQIRLNICPNPLFSHSNSGLINEQIFATDNSNDSHSWNFSINGTSCLMRHWRFWRGFEIFRVSDIELTTIDWGDGSQIENITKTTLYHTYTTCGEKDLEIKTKDFHDCERSENSNIKIYLHQPLPGLNWTPSSPVINQLITFTPNITNWDNNILYVNYYIDGVEEYHHVTEDFYFTKIFSIKKDYVITQEIIYFDCFSNKTISRDYILSMQNMYPICDFSFIRNDKDTYLFTSESEDIDGTIIDYDWKVYDFSISGSPELLAEFISTPKNTFIYHFPYNGIFKIKHSVKDNDNAECFKEIIIDYTASPCKTGCEGCPIEETIVIKSIYNGFEVELQEDIYEIFVEEDDLDIDVEKEELTIESKSEPIVIETMIQTYDEIEVIIPNFYVDFC